MPSLPIVSGADTVRAFERLGFVVARQRGSHIVVRRGSSGCVVPKQFAKVLQIQVVEITAHDYRRS